MVRMKQPLEMSNWMTAVICMEESWPRKRGERDSVQEPRG